MATLLITMGAIWMFCALLMVVGLCAAAAQPVPKINPWGPVFDPFDAEELSTSTSLVSQPAPVR